MNEIISLIILVTFFALPYLTLERMLPKTLDYWIRKLYGLPTPEDIERHIIEQKEFDEFRRIRLINK